MKTLTVDQLKSWKNEDRDFTLINVLSEEDFQRVHIPDSHNIPVDRDDFVDEVERLAGDKEATVVVHCASFDCEASPKAARKLDEAGFRNVYDFEGGIKEWRKHGHEIERGEEARISS